MWEIIELVQVILVHIWTAITAVLSVVRFFLNQLFNIPFGIGYVLYSLFWIGVIVLLVRYTPRRVRESVRHRVRPALWTTTTPARWLLVRWIANPEWIRSRGDPEPQIIEKEVVVHVRRTFREWTASTLWWMAMGSVITITLAFQFRSVVVRILS